MQIGNFYQFPINKIILLDLLFIYLLIEIAWKLRIEVNDSKSLTFMELSLRCWKSNAELFCNRFLVRKYFEFLTHENICFFAEK